MPKHPWRILAVLSLALGLHAGPAPAFTLKTQEGATFRLADQRGKKVVVLDFWATWCGPCAAYLKKLQEVHKQFPDVLVAAVSIDDGQSMGQVDAYVRGRGFTFTVLLDPDANVLRLFNPTKSIPTTVVIDRQGQVVYSHTGYLPGDEQALIRVLQDLSR